MDSYTILGVSPEDDDAKVRKAYLRLAVKQHPDKGGDPSKFQEITDAQHAILEERMATRERHKTMKEIFAETFKEVNAAFERSQTHRRERATQNENRVIERKVNVTLKDLWDGCRRKVATSFQTECVDCGGFGRLSSVTCSECEGSGNREYQVRLGGGLVVANRVSCKACASRGVVADVNSGICSVCRGTGKQGRRLPITVEVPPLSKPGDKVLVRRGGVGLPEGGVLYGIHLKAPVGCKKCEITEGGDLVLVRDVTLREALCGFQWEFEHPGGDFTKLKIRPVSPGEEIRVPKCGWKDGESGERGDLVMKFMLVWPEKTSPGFREAFSAIWEKYENTRG